MSLIFYLGIYDDMNDLENRIKTKVLRLLRLNTNIDKDELTLITRYIETNQKEIEKTLRESSLAFFHLPSEEIGTSHSLRVRTQTGEIDIFLDMEKPFAKGRRRIMLRSLHYHREEVVMIKYIETTSSKSIDILLRDQENLFKLKDIQGVATVYDFFHDEIGGKHRLELIQQFYNQGNLEEFLKSHSLKREEMCSIAVQLSKTVAEIHSRGYVMQDLKPENVIVDYQSKKLNIALCDLETMSRPEEIKNIDVTIEFTPPEILKIILEQMALEDIPIEDRYKSDIWGLGCCLWKLFVQDPLPWSALFQDKPFLKGLNTDIQLEMLELATTFFPEPEEVNSLEHLLWQMFRENPAERIEAQEAIKKLKKLTF